MIENFLRRMEGDKVKCILCRRGVSSAKIKGDGVGVCDACYDRIMQSSVKDYYETKGNIRRLFAPFTYSGALREAIFEFKFGGSFAYGEIFAELVSRALPPYYIYSDYDMLVPVPLYAKRQRERGFNQAELLAEGLSKRLGIPLASDVLFRTRNTMHQMYLTRSLRQRNVSGAFYAVEEEVSGKRILLVDDIYTVGATARACAKELFDKGAEEVSVVAIATNFHKTDYRAPRVRIPTVIK